MKKFLMVGLLFGFQLSFASAPQEQHPMLNNKVLCCAGKLLVGLVTTAGGLALSQSDPHRVGGDVLICSGGFLMGHAVTDYYNLHQPWANRNDSADYKPLADNDDNL